MFSLTKIELHIPKYTCTNIWVNNNSTSPIIM